MKRIVIADDSGTARMFTRRCFEIAGFREAEFAEAENGLEALFKLREKSTDLLVTDLTMPKMDGTELLKRVKTSPDLAAIPVLVISSAGNPAKEKELLEIGAVAIIAKPVSPAKLMPVLETLKRQWIA